MNIWHEIDSMPRPHRLALAGEIIKRDRATMAEVARAAGVSHEGMRRKQIRSDKKDTP